MTVYRKSTKASSKNIVESYRLSESWRRRSFICAIIAATAAAIASARAAGAAALSPVEASALPGSGSTCVSPEGSSPSGSPEEGAPFPSEGLPPGLFPSSSAGPAAFYSNTANGDSSSTVMLARPPSTAAFVASSEPSAFRWTIQTLFPS